MSSDGIRYLNPEIALLYKARHRRPKDDRDLQVAWLPLCPAKRARLLESVRTLLPGHPWLARAREV